MRPTSKTVSRHKPGAFKTVNKAHKAGRHKSNRGLKRKVASGGRVSKLASNTGPSAAAAKAARLRSLPKSEQRNRLKLLRETALAKAVGKTVEEFRALKKEARSNSGSISGSLVKSALIAAMPPALVTFVCADADLPWRLLQAMVEQGAAAGSASQFQFRYVRPTASPTSLIECLDLAKVSDALVLIFQSGSEFTEQFQRALSALYAQGLPNQLYAAVLTAADSQRDRKAWERPARADLESHGFGLPEDCGLLSIRDSADLTGLLRRISSKRLAVRAGKIGKKGGVRGGAGGVGKSGPTFAKARCYGLAEQVTRLPQRGQLRLVTHIRGCSSVGLSNGDLIHLVGWGDFRLIAWSDASPNDDKDVDMDTEQATDTSESAATVPDTAMEAIFGHAPVRKEVQFSASLPTTDSLECVGVPSAQQLDFPDEVDTPKDVPARERFARYRLLTDSSAWDPWTDLPDVYASLVRFSNFTHARNRIVKQARLASCEIAVGRRVALTLDFVPPPAADASGLDAASATTDLPLPEQSTSATLVWYRMLEHENRLSLLNCSIRLNPSRQHPLSSDRNRQLYWQVGWRRFYAAPVFSESDTNSAGRSTGQHRLCLRHLLPGEHAVASFYAPLTFTPAPVIALSSSADQRHTVLLSGSLESCDPARVVLKRSILSGQPFKIHKRSAVIRYLFFNPEDALYYRDAANLRTKHGRRGKILEPVGTHGLCKCHFDGPVTNMDTVLMDLFKRQFPKLSYRPANQ